MRLPEKRSALLQKNNDRMCKEQPGQIHQNALGGPGLKGGGSERGFWDWESVQGQILRRRVKSKEA